MHQRHSTPPAMERAGPDNLLELQEDRQLAALVRNWDFQPGRNFQAHILTRFNSSVHHPSSSLHGAFHLLVVFCRFTFRLSESSVSLALNACLGGTPSGFHVTYLKDRHFQFSVANKFVGFTICDLKRIITESFDVYFHLYWEGGDQWIREHRKWLHEEDSSWTLVSCRKSSACTSKKRVSFAPELVQASPHKKSTPREVMQDHPIKMLRIGGFFCELNTASPQKRFGRISNSQVQARTVFERIKAALPEFRPAVPERNLLLDRVCYRYLAPGHLVRECREQMRC